LDWGVRHFARKPCNTGVGTARSAVARRFLPAEEFARRDERARRRPPRRVAGNLISALACSPEREIVVRDPPHPKRDITAKDTLLFLPRDLLDLWLCRAGRFPLVRDGVCPSFLGGEQKQPRTRNGYCSPSSPVRPDTGPETQT